ncbi:lectin like domain-containing protein [Methanohalophilus mahii]|uniref:Peptidase C1A papain n=1 Tax=Methanohalophilus mahii (strain ATCC 35705 / DSM 5219 / SLP) TaxID=547558 RepID=D5E8Z7_METMS|nr:lectin like domain-containing protein [Methanohalophilus mahii]ADE35648.1 peptidase C1A papain [Methanohalophilus mahii DSM 5219]
MLKRILLLTIITLLLLNTAALASENNPEITSAPLNPDFIDYQSSLQKSDEKTMLASSAQTPSYSLGLVPSPVDLSHLQPKKPGNNRLFTAQSLPGSYDLREHNRLTPVKDQGDTGSCWTFATYASLESCTYDEGPYNFSENHMKNILSNESPTGFDFEQGGSLDMATAYLARWSGPVNETDDPYSDNSSYNDYTNPDKPVTRHVQEVIYLPPRNNVSANDHLKEAVREYGALYTSFKVNRSAFADNATTYYYNGSEYEGGHAVALVGWNDSFPKEEFIYEPPGDGAFIVKNSWGTELGDSGYLYISYYEETFNAWAAAIFLSAANVDNHDNIYQYDPLGYTDSRGFSNSTTVHGANVFQSSSEEYLEAVSFYTTDTNAVYNVSIYTNLSSSTPVGQTLVAQTNGTFAHAGYHTVTLDTPVNLAEGQKFSVTNKISNPEHEYPLAAEYPESNYSSRASANPNESFMSFDGSNWTDVGKLNNTSICIKAFTSAPPSNVSNLTAVVGSYWINWTWSNPDDKDFNHTEIYVNDTLISNTSDTYYNLTGLLDATNHSIGLRTVDTDGYVNSTWINNTSQTLDIAPAAVTDLHVTSSTSDSITWGWTNPANHDFDHVEIYLDNVFQANTSESVYRVSDLKSGHAYKIGLKTVDKAGNINNTTINDIASTKSKSSGNAVKGITTSREGRENIVSKSSQIQKVVADENVYYDFEDGSISFIEFKGTSNAGQIKILIENLKDTSSLVDQQPPGKVYSNFNVWVGDNRFDTNNLEDSMIGFKVSKTWLNDINPDSVVLLHYTNAWQVLDTVQTEEDADYFYFEAQADGFSPFAISAVDSTTGTDEISRPDDSEQSASGSAEPTAGNPSENTTEPAETIPGPGVLAVLGIICILYVIRTRL